MRYIYCLLLLVLVSCGNDDSNDNPDMVTARRTVVVYMSGDNNLSTMGFLENDISEIKEGRKKVSKDENLVVYVDQKTDGKTPFLARVTQDGKLDTLYRYHEDFYSSDPQRMTDVLNKAIQLCPAKEDYGLVFWGHATGWLIEKDSISHRAYGLDQYSNQSEGLQLCWINLPSLREVLTSLHVKWKFIFFDCCNMLNAEVAYELRENTEYLIGSPAEIPGKGAPYQLVVKDMFTHNDETLYTSLCNHYYEQDEEDEEHTPLAVVKTDAMPQLATATRQILPQLNLYLTTSEDPTRNAIYYYGDPKEENCKSLYDMQDIIHTALKDDDASYQQWKNAFDQAVVYSRSSTLWQTDFSDIYFDNYISFSDFTEIKDGIRVFKHGDDYCGVMSMFFPMEKYNTTLHPYNEDIKQLRWYYAVGWPGL